MGDINTSFFDGALDVDTAKHLNLADDSSDSEIAMQDKLAEAMNKPATYYLIISQDNKLFKAFSGLELLVCVMSSYYYAFMSTFADHGQEEGVDIPVLIFETFFGLSMFLQFFLEFNV